MPKASKRYHIKPDLPFKKRKGNRAHPGSLERLQYLENLLKEFQSTKRNDYKLQILANLSNFAYDARNIPHLLQLGILDLFLEQIALLTAGQIQQPGTSQSSSDDYLLRAAEFSSTGLSNIIAACGELHPELFTDVRLTPLYACFDCSSEQLIVSILTILIHLRNPKLLNEAQRILSLQFEDPRVKHFARLYLDDHGCLSNPSNQPHSQEPDAHL